MELVDSLQKRITKIDVAIKMMQTEMNPPDLKKDKKKKETTITPLKVLDTTPPEPPKPKVSPMAKLYAAISNKVTTA